MPYPRPNERGVTVMELMIAMGIFALMVVPLSALVYKSTMARQISQDSLHSQQEGATVLSRFTDDVRASTHMTSPLGQSAFVTMRRPTSLTTFSFITWRLSDGKLQRGESAVAATPPGAWQDVIDPRIFTVEAGRFAYYTLDNRAPETNDATRRLELRELALHSKSTGAALKPPAVSAVMREPAQARSLAVTAPWQTWGDDQNWHNAVHVEFPLKNLSGKDLLVGAFAATWDDHEASGYIKSMDLAADNTSTWGGGQGEYRSGGAPETLESPLSIASGATATVRFHFMAEARLESFTMTLFDAADTTHARPYVLKVR